MKQSIVWLGLLILALIVTPSQANFVQCPGGFCGTGEGTTNNADLINGTEGEDNIEAQGGNDIIFGGAGLDGLSGDGEDDLIFGGAGSDGVFGIDGNDILFAGPDDGLLSQFILGGEGNDAANVLASEVTTCLFIDGGEGSDVANLIGFGPYSAVKPYGQPDFNDGYILVVDPITGGLIFIEVDATDDEGTETVNGLPSPNVTILPFDSEEELSCPALPFPL